MSEATLIDTSVWIDLLRDSSGNKRRQLADLVDPEDVVLTRFTEMELLQGCRDEREWGLLSSYLRDQEYLAVSDATWANAARIFFDLRRTGRTVRSPIDCCIAQLALESGMVLLHRDRDFDTISQIRPEMRQSHLDWR
ncbi:MAG: PIN domain-containing protein [Myxococcota bacterium]|nr:PIN domain-containing protein [Myxococcota bacterium]